MQNEKSESGKGLESLSDIQEALNRLQESSTLTINLEGGDTVLGELSKIGKTIYESLNLKTYAENIQEYSFAVDNLRAGLARTFGVAKDDVGKIQQTIALSYKDVINMGGDVKDIVIQQDAITKTLNTNIIASKENVNDLYATFKVTNQSPERLIGGFREVGFSMTHIKDEMQKVVDTSHTMGVNTTEVSKRVVDNIGKLNLYNFEGGVQGLAKMAAQSALLGINMESTFRVADDLLDPQKAIDLSASLQRLGVTSSQLLDPLRAMDLAQNDPAELQNQMVELSKQFVRTKEDGSFEILPGAKRQMKEIETALGMNRGELSKMALQSAEVAKKMSEIRFPDGLNATEEQKNTIANLAQFNKLTGKYEISLGLDESGNEIKKSIDQLSEVNNEELTKMLDDATKPVKIEDLAKGQLSELQKMNAEGLKIKYAGRLETSMAQGDVIAKGTGNLITSKTKNLTPTEEESAEMYAKQSKSVDKARADLNEGKNLSLSDITKLFENAGETYLESVKIKTSGVLETLGEDLKSLGGGEVMKDVGEKLVKLSDNIKELDLKNLFENELVKNIVQGIKDGFKTITSNDAIIDVKNNIVHQFDEGDVTAFIQKDKIEGNNISENINTTKKDNEPIIIDNRETSKSPTINFDMMPLTDVMSKTIENIKKQAETNPEIFETFKSEIKNSLNPTNHYEKLLNEVSGAINLMSDNLKVDKQGTEPITNLKIDNTNVQKQIEELSKVLGINKPTISEKPNFDDKLITTNTDKRDPLEMMYQLSKNMDSDRQKQLTETVSFNTETLEKIMIEQLNKLTKIEYNLGVKPLATNRTENQSLDNVVIDQKESKGNFNTETLEKIMIEQLNKLTKIEYHFGMKPLVASRDTKEDVIKVDNSNLENKLSEMSKDYTGIKKNITTNDNLGDSRQITDIVKNMSNQFGSMVNPLIKPKDDITTTITATNVTPKIELPTLPKIENTNMNQTHEHKFGNFEISVNVNSNNPNIPTEQIVNAVKESFANIEIQQAMKSGLNKANTNNGLTSQGGTSNYGPQKIDYSLG